jgi:hypothetical protein
MEPQAEKVSLVVISIRKYLSAVQERHVVDEAYVPLLHGSLELMSLRYGVHGIQGFGLGLCQTWDARGAGASVLMADEAAPGEIEDDLSIVEVEQRSAVVRWLSPEANALI